MAKAVTEVANKLEADSGKVTRHVITITGLVADVSGDTLILNVGSKACVKVGDHLLVRRSTREIKDPTIGKVIRRVEDSVGEVRVVATSNRKPPLGFELAGFLESTSSPSIRNIATLRENY